MSDAVALSSAAFLQHPIQPCTFWVDGSVSIGDRSYIVQTPEGMRYEVRESDFHAFKAHCEAVHAIAFKPSKVRRKPLRWIRGNQRGRYSDAVKRLLDDVVWNGQPRSPQ